MDEVDRLGWAAGIAFVSYGVRFGIRVNDPALVEQLPPYLPPGWKAARSPVVDYLYDLWSGESGAPLGSRPHRLYAGGRVCLRTADLEHALQGLESLLDFNVALGACRRLFVHAGVAGWRGHAIVMPGRSRSGKTSLIEALVRAGAVYYSDEYAVFDARGRVHPYPRPLSIREGQGERRRYPVEELGGRVGTRPLPVGFVVVTRYEPGARWRPRVLSPGEAVLRLLDNTILARTRPCVALSTFQNFLTHALAIRSARGEARDVVGPLLDRFDRAVESPRASRTLIQEPSTKEESS